MKVKDLVAELLKQDQEATAFVRTDCGMRPVVEVRTAREVESPPHPKLPWRRMALGSFVLVN